MSAKLLPSKDKQNKYYLNIFERFGEHHIFFVNIWI